MSQKFMDPGQIVGYDFEDGKKQLVVTVSDRTATKMLADGWDIKHEDELGYFVIIELQD